ncbi:MAG TPA: NAD(P)H nitroreductase [Mycobacterium sp.]|nr:NAD(P)H nitroreductase [Mycobacterium sp.]
MRDTLVDLEVIKRAVRLACRAPSLHNSQPWRWVVEGNRMHLYLDRKRILYATDRAGHEAIISCGAVLDHFSVAMAAAGWTAGVDRLPTADDPDLLASIDFAPIDFVTAAHRRWTEAILLRRTNRHPFAPPMQWTSVGAQLHSAVNTDAVRLDVLSDDARAELKEASLLTESLRLYDNSYHSELDWWTAPYPASEGIPYSSLVPRDCGDQVDVGRSFPAPHHQGPCGDIPADYSKIVVLSTYGDSHEDALRCGEVLSSVLLRCTVAGLATCTLTHITELRASRRIIADLIGQDTTPQVLVRVGVAASKANLLPATPRRPLAEVLIVRR